MAVVVQVEILLVVLVLLVVATPGYLREVHL
jgi:hypothetical protein